MRFCGLRHDLRRLRRMQQSRHRRRQAGRQWVVFIVVAAVLCALIWGAWVFLGRGRTLPGLGLGSDDKGGSLTVALPEAPASLDIRHDDSDALQQALLGNVYESLLTVDDNNQLIPGLATTWKTSADGKTTTLTLREGVRFANGHAMAADDAMWSLQQAVEGQCPGVEELGNLVSVNAPDEHTLVIETAEPVPSLLRALAGRMGIVHDREAKVDYATDAAGTGPFVVKQYQAGSSITLARNNRYWGDKAKAASITLRYLPDETQLIDALTSGQADLAAPKPTATSLALKDNQQLSVAEGQGTRKIAVFYNTALDSIFSIPRARIAFRQLVDRQTLVATIPDAAQALGGPVAPLEPGYEDLTDLLPYDQTAALGLLSLYGARYIHQIKIIAPQSLAQTGQMVRDQLAVSGRDITFEALDDATLASRVEARDFSILIREVDGEAGTAMFANPDSPGGYTNGDVQELFEAAEHSRDETAYAEAIKPYARALVEDSGGNWLYSVKTMVVSSKQVTGAPAANLADRRLPLAGVSKAA